jgi:hypothetical protein
MLVRAGQLTASRAVGRDVLVSSDTSEMNFANHTGRKQGFGTVGNGKNIGLFIHPLVAVDANHGGIIGPRVKPEDKPGRRRGHQPSAR